MTARSGPGCARPWEAIHQLKHAHSVSWLRAHRDVSIELLLQTGRDADNRVVDAGGGASSLVDTPQYTLDTPGGAAQSFADALLRRCSE